MLIVSTIFLLLTLTVIVDHTSATTAGGLPEYSGIGIGLAICLGLFLLSGGAVCLLNFSANGGMMYCRNMICGGHEDKRTLSQMQNDRNNTRNMSTIKFLPIQRMQSANVYEA